MQTLQKLTSAAIALSLAASTSLYATNGDTLIGVGAKTRAMGGAGIALSQGAESTLVNPALITHVQDTEISFGGTIFMPDIHTENTFDPDGPGAAPLTTFAGDSDADLNLIPAVAITSRVGENLYLGAGMYGTAGMGVDFRGKSPGLFDMETTLQLMQFAAPVAYKAGGLSVGVAPIVQYGSLDINYKNPMTGGSTVGYGQKQDFGFGASVGMTYDFDNGLSVGAVYKSKIKMKYEHVLTTAAGPFGIGVGDTLTQPAEIGVGVAYHAGAHSIAIDYKKIKWGSAAGYKEFNWKDQNVFAIGYQYDAGTWALRLGYNHAKTPIRLTDGTTPAGAALNMFNLLGFPATSENHFTAGASYAFNQNFSADFTLVYSPKKTVTANTSGMFGPGAQIENSHKELGLSVQLNYKF